MNSSQLGSYERFWCRVCKHPFTEFMNRSTLMNTHMLGAQILRPRNDSIVSNVNRTACLHVTCTVSAVTVVISPKLARKPSANPYICAYFSCRDTICDGKNPLVNSLCCRPSIFLENSLALVIMVCVVSSIVTSTAK